jgi:hypothetical protein
LNERDNRIADMLACNFIESLRESERIAPHEKVER